MTTRRLPPLTLLSALALSLGACTTTSPEDLLSTTDAASDTSLPSTTSANETSTDGTGDGDGDDATTEPTTDDPTDDPTDPDPTDDPTDPDPTTGDGDGDPDPTTTGDGDGDPDPTTGGDESACQVPDPGWGGVAQTGQPAPHFSGTNQFGEEMSICEYEGLPIVIDTSAVWCGPCQLLSDCLGGNDNACLQVFGGNQQVLDFLFYPLRPKIANGEFGWFTVLTENANGGPPSLADSQAWEANFPAEGAWIIADEQQQYYGHLPIEGFPSVWLINPQMNWQDLNQMTVWNTMINSYL